VHQDEADLAAGGAAPLYPGFIPGGSAHAGEQLMRRPCINGRKGTNMAPFGYLLSPDDVWRVHAFVMSRNHL